MEIQIAKKFLSECDQDAIKLTKASKKAVYTVDDEDPNLHAKLLEVPEYQRYWDEKKPKEKSVNHVLKDFAMAATQVEGNSKGLHSYLELAESIIYWYRQGSGEYYELEKATRSSDIIFTPSCSTPSKEKLSEPLKIYRNPKSSSISPTGSDSGAGSSSNKASPSPKSIRKLVNALKTTNDDDDEVDDVEENNWTGGRGSGGSQSYQRANGYLVEPLSRTRTGGKGTKRGRQIQYVRSDDEDEFPEA